MKRIIKKLSLLTLILFLIMIALIIGSNLFDEKAEQCDNYYGYRCSYYQIKTFSK